MIYPIPRPTEVYRHWKTKNLYTVVGVSRDSEAWCEFDARCVVYFRLSGVGRPGDSTIDAPQLIHRPLKNWREHIDRDDYSGPRFILESGVR